MASDAAASTQPREAPNAWRSLPPIRSRWPDNSRRSRRRRDTVVVITGLWMMYVILCIRSPPEGVHPRPARRPRGIRPAGYDGLDHGRPVRAVSVGAGSA